MGQKKNCKGVIGRTFEDSKFSWEPLNEPPAGTPNILIVLLDLRWIFLLNPKKGLLFGIFFWRVCQPQI